MSNEAKTSEYSLVIASASAPQSTLLIVLSSAARSAFALASVLTLTPESVDDYGSRLGTFDGSFSLSAMAFVAPTANAAATKTELKNPILINFVL